MFLGSFNWDPRSAYINTELGVIIDFPEIAGFTAAELDKSLKSKAYEVILDEDDQLRWISHEGGTETVLTTEPETTWWDRFSVGVMVLLPIKGQL